MEGNLSSFLLPSSRAALHRNLSPLPPPFSSLNTSRAVSKCMLTWHYLQHTSSLHEVRVVKCNSHSGTSKQYSMVGHKQDRFVSNQLRQTVTLRTVFCCSFKVWIIGKVIIETAVSLMVHVKNFFLQHSWKPIETRIVVSNNLITAHCSFERHTILKWSASLKVTLIFLCKQETSSRIITCLACTEQPITVEPVLSGHPRGIAKWPLNTGWPPNTVCTWKFGICRFRGLCMREYDLI